MKKHPRTPYGGRYAIGLVAGNFSCYDPPPPSIG
jgi:hypothetical protein